MTGDMITGFFDTYPDGVALLDVETGTVLRANERCGELAGCPTSQLAGESLTALSPDDWTPRSPVGVLLSRARDGRVTFDWRIERPDGTCLDLECAMRTVGDGQAVVTVRKRHSGVVSEADNDRQELLNGMNDAVFVVDWEGNYIDANRVATERLGYTRAELLSMGPADISPADHARRVDERLQELEDSETLVFETVHVAADGTSLPVEINARRITYGGEPAVLSVARDITERKERERRLRTFEQAVEHAGHAIYITDTDGTIEYVNPAFEEMTGYDSDQALGQTPSILSTGENDETYYAALWETVLDGEVWQERIENERADGTRYVADQTIAPIQVDSNSPARPDSRTGAGADSVVKFVAIQQDVTEQCERELELERYHQLMENVPVGVFRNTPGIAGTFEEVNPAMVEMFDADGMEDLVGRPVAELYRTPSQRELFSRKLEREGVVVDEELRLETLDGETFWGAVTAVKYEVDGDIYYDGIIQDVTERRESERELRLREQRFRRLFEDHNAAMLLIDPETGTIERANDAAADFYGYDREELTVMNVHDINQLSDEEVAARRREADEEEQNRFIFPHELADGEIRQVEVDTTPIHTGDGRLLFSIIHDVTEREQTRERLEHQNEQLELLNRVVRHDIRNDMSVVLGHAEILDEYVVDDGQQYLDAVQEHSEHIVELTRTARELMETLLGEDGADPGAVELEDVLRTELNDARAAYDDATFTGGESLPDVDVCGNELLSSVFRNLLNNAIQHNDTDHPQVSVGVEDRGTTVEVTVADNGPGVPDGQKEAIFGKGEHGIRSSGTGLGLYLVYTFVDQFGGDVWVTDNDPTGAVFHVELPKAN